MIDQRDKLESIEPIEAKDPIESTEATEPTDPIESTEPTEPIERMDPFEPIDRIEFSDRTDHREFREVVDPMSPTLLERERTCRGPFRKRSERILSSWSRSDESRKGRLLRSPRGVLGRIRTGRRDPPSGAVR